MSAIFLLLWFSSVFEKYFSKKLNTCFLCHQLSLSILNQGDNKSDVVNSWYPPLEKTISCLSKLYRCLEPAVFTGLAQVLEHGNRFSCLTYYEVFISHGPYFFYQTSSGSC